MFVFDHDDILTMIYRVYFGAIFHLVRKLIDHKLLECASLQ